MKPLCRILKEAEEDVKLAHEIIKAWQTLVQKPQDWRRRYHNENPLGRHFAIIANERGKANPFIKEIHSAALVELDHLLSSGQDEQKAVTKVLEELMPQIILKTLKEMNLTLPFAKVKKDLIKFLGSFEIYDISINHRKWNLYTSAPSLVAVEANLMEWIFSAQATSTKGPPLPSWETSGGIASFILQEDLIHGRLTMTGAYSMPQLGDAPLLKIYGHDFAVLKKYSGDLNTAIMKLLDEPNG